MIKRIAAGLAIVGFVLALGGTASAGTRVTSTPGGDMTHNFCAPSPDCDMTHN